MNLNEIHCEIFSEIFSINRFGSKNFNNVTPGEKEYPAEFQYHMHLIILKNVLHKKKKIQYLQKKKENVKLTTYNNSYKSLHLITLKIITM